MSTSTRIVSCIAGSYQCPWRRVFEVWPRPLPSLADAAIVAVASANRYEAVATFDRKLANRLEGFGLSAYW